VSSTCQAAEKIRVVVWDEQQPRQKEAYADFLGNAIAGHLKKNAAFEVSTKKLNDKKQGISDETLENCDVLVWWGHVRQHEITTATAKKIVARIKAGKLSLIALHSAHWSAPFMEAMNERTRIEAQKRYGSNKNVRFDFVDPPGRFAPTSDSLVTPAYYALKRGRNVGLVRVDLPNCCFPDYRPDGKPSVITVLKPDHPIAKGLPKKFTLPHTEMYNEPFHVPAPDEVVFREDWEQGEWFRSGSVWNIGQGKVFYFRPGHETYGVYLEPEPLQIIENAVQWLGTKK
jgi:trehalose utilization protein